MNPDPYDCAITAWERYYQEQIETPLEEPMSEAKQGHTPGPWEVEGVMCDEVNGEAYEVHADGGAISIAAPPSEADAYLIAAAPDLLAALRLWSSYTNDPYCGPTEFAAAVKATDAAIRKATGAG